MRTTPLTDKENRKNRAAVTAKVTALLCSCLLVMFLLCACGGSSGGAGPDSAGTGDKDDAGSFEGAAAKYAALFSSKDSTYYMKASVESQSGAQETTEDIIETAQAPGKQMISSESSSYIQFYLSGKQYYYDTLNMTYYELDVSGGSESADAAYAPSEGFEGTEDGTFEGQPVKIDTYRNETKYEGVRIVSTTQYYVSDDEAADLVAIVSEQKNKVTGKIISRVTMRVQEFSTELPDGVFDLPKGFTKASDQFGQPQ